MTDEQILRILQEAGDFVSGEQIGGMLSLSRTAVWKAVNKLKAKGYSIESVPRRGYRFVSAADILSAGELSPLCHTEMVGRCFIYAPNCPSTNDEAKAGGLRGDEEGTVYITDQQTCGRGRMGRNWHNEKNQGIALSILLKPVVSPAQIMPISLLAGLSVCKALESETGLPCQVKWPNDIVIGGRKIAGVLIEMTTAGEMVQFIVLGIGVNANNAGFPEDLRDVATSIYLERGLVCSRKGMVCRILECFEQDYLQWVREMEESFEHPGSPSSEASYLAEYRSRCINLGREVAIHQRGQVLVGTAKDITPDGKLLVVLADGEERAVLSGEVSVRGIYGYA